MDSDRDTYIPQIILEHYYPPPDYYESTSIMTTENNGNQGTDSGKISLNVHLTVPPPEGGVVTQDGSHTPNTPEILNSIVSMTSGPFHEYVPPQVVTAATLMEPQPHLISPTYSQVSERGSTPNVDNRSEFTFHHKVI